MKNMNKTIRLLAVIVIAQLLFIVATHMGGDTLAQHSGGETILAFDKTQVDHLLIEQKGKDDQESEKVSLSKKDDKWQTEAGFPVSAGKVDGLLDRLAGLKHGLPVATSSSALTRFKVDDDDYERRITLKNGDKKLAVLYLGSGAGARQTHARSDTQAAVYTVELGVYDAPTKVENWQDKNLLKLSTKEVSELKLADMSFKLNPTADKKTSLPIWKTDSLPENKIVNQKAINESVEKLASLSFSKVLGKEKKSEYGLDKPELNVILNYKGKAREYQLGKLKDKDDYVLKLSDRAEYFQIASYTGKPLLDGIAKNKWLMDKPKTQTQADTPSTVTPVINTTNPVKQEEKRNETSQ